MTHRTDDPRLERLQGTLDMLILSTEELSARIRPTNVFERAGEGRMTQPASSISSQVRPRISFLAPAGGHRLVRVRAPPPRSWRRR